MAEPERPSIVGPLQLQDWVVPVLFQRQDYALLPGACAAENTLEEFAAEVAQAVEAGGGEIGEGASMDGFPEPERYGFVGRDGDVLMLERLMRQHDALLVQGMAWIGKSSLARHFAEWLGQTGGIDAAFFTNFEQGGSREYVLAQVGRAVLHVDFSRMPPEQQEQVALRILRKRRCLLVWDNFESVRGFPTVDFEKCTTQERKGLQQLLEELAGTESTVLITSRREEEWVGTHGLYELEGLPPPDAHELAAKVLAQHAVEPAEVGEELEELIEELDYHPLALQAVLPRLRETPARQIIEELRAGKLCLPGAEGDRERNLQASLDLSLQGLSEDTHQLLPLLALFTGYVHADVAATLTGKDSAWAQEHGPADGEAWRRALDELADVALLKRVGEAAYAILPALPAHLTDKYQEQVSAGLRDELQDVSVEMYARLARRIAQVSDTDPERAARMATMEQRNLRASLHRAIEHKRWRMAQMVLLVLSWHLKHTRRWRDAQHCFAVVLAATENQTANTDAANLRLIALSQLASTLLDRWEQDEAERVCHQLLADLGGMDTPLTATLRVNAYHQLGIIEQRRGRHEDADEWYQKALGIAEQIGRDAIPARTWHQISRNAGALGRYEDAEQWSRKALEHAERIGDQHLQAASYQQLGYLAQSRGMHDEAEQQYLRSLETFRRLRADVGAASSYQGLGRIAEARGHYGEAEELYLRALQTHEQVGLETAAADDYHNLGNIAYVQGRQEDATDWYRRSLDVNERLGRAAPVAHAHHQLGMIAQARGQLDEAERQYCLSLQISQDLGPETDVAATYHQLGRIAQERRQYDDAKEYYSHSLEISERLANKAGAARTMAQLGVLEAERGNVDVARRRLRCALAIFEQCRMGPEIALVREHLAALKDE